MKRKILAFAAVCALAATLAYAAMPKAEPDALWHYITQVSPYSQWSDWPDHPGMQPGRAPHGALHKVFVNDLALHSSKPPVAYGSIAVKENYTAQKKLAAITVMYKLKGFDPDNGDWYWAKYTPDGKAEKFGNPKGCVGCHATRAKNDYILVHEFN